jgi:hypothetical protein
VRVTNIGCRTGRRKTHRAGCGLGEVNSECFRISASGCVCPVLVKNRIDVIRTKPADIAWLHTASRVDKRGKRGLVLLRYGRFSENR